MFEGSATTGGLSWWRGNIAFAEIDFMQISMDGGSPRTLPKAVLTQSGGTKCRHSTSALSRHRDQRIRLRRPFVWWDPLELAWLAPAVGHRAIYGRPQQHCKTSMGFAWLRTCASCEHCRACSAPRSPASQNVEIRRQTVRRKPTSTGARPRVAQRLFQLSGTQQGAKGRLAQISGSDLF